MFRYLLLLNLKTFARQKSRLFAVLILTVLVSAIAGLAGDFFLTDGVLAEPIAIAVVDLDDTAETRMILSAIVDDPIYDDLLEFSIHTARDAQAALDNGEITAIITFPDGFARGLLMGRNIPFEVTYSGERPLAAALVRVATESFADMLRSSQIGVYVTLNFANNQGVSRAEFDRVMMAVNMRFIGLVMNRSEVFDSDEQSVTGGLTIQQAYLIPMHFVLMLCAAFVMTDSVRQNFSRFFVINLKNRGISPLQVFLACCLANFLLFTAINAGLGLWIFGFGINMLLAIAVISVAFAAFAAMIAFVFDTSFSAGSFCAVVVGVSLALSGGIIPIEFFSDGLRMASDAVFNTWAVRLVSAVLLGESVAVSTAACIAFALIFATIGCIATYRRGRIPQ